MSQRYKVLNRCIRGRSESKQEYQIGNSEIVGLFKISRENEERQSKVHGLIQNICISPASIMLWTESQVKSVSQNCKT